MSDWALITGFVVLDVIIPIVLCKLYSRKFYTCGDTEEDIKKFNLFTKKWYMASISLVIVFSIVLAVLINYRSLQRGIFFTSFEGNSVFYELLCIFLGTTFTIAPLSFIVLMKKLEFSLTWLPHDKKYQLMPFLSRILIPTFFIET